MTYRKNIRKNRKNKFIATFILKKKKQTKIIYI